MKQSQARQLKMEFSVDHESDHEAFPNEADVDRTRRALYGVSSTVLELRARDGAELFLAAIREDKDRDE